MENYVKIEVMSQSGNYYDNAFIENDFDAFRVAKFYREELGYIVRVSRNGRDLTSMLDTMQIVKVEKF